MTPGSTSPTPTPLPPAAAGPRSAEHDARRAAGMITFFLNGGEVRAGEDHASLLDALREELGDLTPKDGCSPQGQCGCCTVLIDGAPRVACVTPLRRVAGRQVTTTEGLDAARRELWAGAFTDA